MILIIDNYDSFTYNLVQYVGHFYKEIKIARNDKISLEEIKKLKTEGIIISPGPKTPKEAGLSVDIIKEFYKEVPILGVCLGHQSIAYAFGGKVISAKSIMHGKLSLIEHDAEGLYKNINNPLSVVRYHSLVADPESLPECLEISSKTKDGTIMGIRHKNYPTLEGVQFHPESVKTDEGRKIIYNFLQKCKLNI